MKFLKLKKNRIKEKLYFLTSKYFVVKFEKNNSKLLNNVAIKN